MSERFLTSDTHFFHANILEFCSNTRPFASIEEMNEALIDKWNSVVTKNDHVFHLGDVVLGGAKNMYIVSRLNGVKHLVAGNHDYIRSNMDVYQQHFVSIEAYREFGHGFAICSHYPVHTSQLDTRYRVNIHGHLHDDYVLDKFGNRDMRYKNVCSDANNLTPVSWEDVVGRK